MKQDLFSGGMAGQMEQLKKKKRYDEIHAFDCLNVEDANFVVGAGKNYTAPIAISIFVMVTIYIGSSIIKDTYIMGKEPDLAELAVPIGIILMTALLCGALVIYSFVRPQLAVQGREFFFGKNWYKAEQVWEMHIARQGQITVSVEGKKLVTYGLLDNNSEKLIAWARKCDVPIIDERSEFEG